MDPADSDQVSRDWSYSGTSREVFNFQIRDCHPLWSTFPSRSSSKNFLTLMCKALQPHRGNPHGLGCSAFARRYLRNRFFFLFLVLLRCFSSHGWLRRTYVFSASWFRNPRDQCLFVNSPKLFADFHAFHRLLMPRHPPYALSSLTTNIQPSRDKTSSICRTQSAPQSKTLHSPLKEPSICFNYRSS